MEFGNLVRQDPAPGNQLITAPPAVPLGVPAGYPTLEPQPNVLLDFWRLALKHRWVIVATFVIVTVLASVYTFRKTPLYEATARIAINRESGDLLGFKDMTGASAGDEEFDYNVVLDTQVRVLESDSLALQVIRELQLDRMPYFAGKYADQPQRTTGGAPVATDPKAEALLLKNFHASLSVSKVPRTRVVELRFLSPNPKLSAQIVNTLTNSYIEQNFRTKYESTMLTTNWLSKQLTDLQMKVETSQEKLVQYQKENQILGIDEKQNIITAKLSELNQQLTSAEGARMQKQAVYELSKKGTAEALPGVTDNRIIQRLKEQQADLKNEYAQANTRYGPSFPKVQELSNQIAQAEAALQAELRRVENRVAAEYQEAVSREGMLRAALENQKGEANRLNERAIQYNILKREVDTNRTLYEGLLQKMKEAGVSAGLRSGNIRILDVARVPAMPAKPNIPMNITVAMFLGLCLGVGLSFVIENMDNSIHFPEEVTAVCGLPPLAIIPLNAGGASRKMAYGSRKALPAAQAEANNEPVALISHNRPKSEIAESYRALRTSILLSSVGAGRKVIMLTSGLPQEGKTTTSVNTATVLAQRGGRVLLVEADMRRPGISRALGMKRHSGLSELLAGMITMEQAITTLPQVPNLDVVVAGTPPPNPAELLGSPGMRECLALWRERYDYVVIDTPPVLTVTDAVLLSPEADAVLLVIRAGQTTQPALRRARQLLGLVNARVIGVVVNAVDLQAHGYHYYSYYGGYGHYGNYYQEEEETAGVTAGS